MTAQIDTETRQVAAPRAAAEQAYGERQDRRLDQQRHRERGEVAAHRAWLDVVGLTVVAFALAVTMPLAASVVGLMVFGILHNAFELRYVVARCRDTLRGPFVWSVLALITVIAVMRLAGAHPVARRTELVAGFAILAAGLVHGGRTRPVLLGLGLPAVVVAGWVAWRDLDTYFVAVTYLHNLVPVVFLWDWSARALSGRARRTFRTVQLGWFVAVPALLLSGVVSVAVRPAGWLSFAGPAAGHIAAATPEAWRGSAVAPRFLAVFAFLQVMHYGLWCWFFPRRGAGAGVAAAPRRVSLRVAVVGAVAAVFAAGFVVSWAAAKTSYVSVASYHAYVEYAVLAALLAGLPARHPGGVPALSGRLP